MGKNFWLFSKKNEPAADFDEINNDYYGESMSANASDAGSSFDPYADENGDVSVVLTGDPSKKEPLMKKTFTPLTCNDSASIVDAFKDGRVVVICVEELDKPNFLRLFDYLMGAVQALDGELERIDRDTVVLLPYGVDEDISIDSLEEDISEDENDVVDGEDIDDGDIEDED